SALDVPPLASGTQTAPGLRAPAKAAPGRLERRRSRPSRCKPAAAGLHVVVDAPDSHNTCSDLTQSKETTMIPPRVSGDVVRERIGTYADKQQTAEERYAIYKELIGFLPPRIEARINVTGALDPELLDLQERMRARAMYPKCFDVKTAQLMLFGMLLMDM